MAIYNSLKEFPELQNTVLTIGTFDGVHLGHQKLFEILIEKAKTTNSETVVITFNPHPQHVVGKDVNMPKRIVTEAVISVILYRQGVKHHTFINRKNYYHEKFHELLLLTFDLQHCWHFLYTNYQSYKNVA